MTANCFHCFPSPPYSSALMKAMQLTAPTSPTVKPGGDIHLDRCCPWRLGNQFLCWLEMAVSPLAPQGFKAPNRSGCRLWALNLTTSGVVMDQDWNQTASWHKAKRKCPGRLSQNSRAEDRHAELSRCSRGSGGCREIWPWSKPGCRGDDNSPAVFPCSSAFGRAVVEVLFNGHLDAPVSTVGLNPTHFSQTSSVSIKSDRGSTHRVGCCTYDENQKLQGVRSVTLSLTSWKPNIWSRFLRITVRVYRRYSNRVMML